MNLSCPNKPYIILTICFLWLTSLLFIGYSLILFLCIGDILVLTGLDLVNCIVLLSGVIMFPTNVYMLWCIAQGKTIDHRVKMVCCPLWLCIIWILFVNFVGVILVIHRIRICPAVTQKSLSHCMLYYRNIPKYKNVIDNLQWSLKCCGLNSYKDWFRYDWYDKTRDYDWDPAASKIISRVRKIVDSVPLSCCKNGSCVSNYLSELGTRSINKNGCESVLRHIIQTCMYAHMIIFVLIIVAEVLILWHIVLSKRKSKEYSNEAETVHQILSVNNHFQPSSNSYQLNPEESD